MQKNERADLFAKLAARTNSNWPCEDRHLPRERMRVQTRRWIGRSAGDANLMRLRRHFLTSSKGLLDPPKACYERRAEALRSATRECNARRSPERPVNPSRLSSVCGSALYNGGCRCFLRGRRPPSSLRSNLRTFPLPI